MKTTKSSSGSVDCNRGGLNNLVDPEEILGGVSTAPLS